MPPTPHQLSVDLPAELAGLPAQAARQRDVFLVLYHYLHLDSTLDDLPDSDLDALVDRIAAPVIAAVDCTRCANCCRSLPVYVTPPDVARLAAGLESTAAAVSAQYVDRAGAVPAGEWGRMNASPCPFLAGPDGLWAGPDGRLCGVYPHRPQSCRIYPALTPDFRWLLPEIIEGAAFCPITFHTLRALVAHFGLAAAQSYFD